MKNTKKKKDLALLSLTIAAIGLSVALPMSNHFSYRASATGETQKIKIGYFEYLSFQEGTSDDGIKSGYAYEIYQKISDYTGWEYEYVYGDWSVLLEKLKTGEIDLFAGLSKTDDRMGLIEWSEIPMDVETHSLFVRKDDKTIKEDDYTTLNNKKLGVVKGSDMTVHLQEWVHSEGLNPIYKEYENLDEIQNDLDANILDGYVACENNVSVYRNARVYKKLCNVNSYISVRNNAPEILNQLNYALQTIEEENPKFFSDLKKKYYSTSVVYASFTSEEEQWIDNHPVLKIGYEDDYLPFSKDDGTGSGDPTGVILDIVDAWLSGLRLQERVKIIYKRYSDYDKMFAALKDGEIDTVFPIMDNMWYSERNGIICASNLVSSAIVAIYKDVFTEESLNSISYSSHSAIQEICANIYYPNAKKYVFANRDQCLDAVLSGQVGCTLFNSARAEMAVRESKYSSLKISSLGKTVDYSFAVRKGDKILLSILNRGISLTNINNFTNKTFNYVSYDSEYTFKEFLRDNVVWMILVVATVLGGFLVMQLVHSKRMSVAFDQVKRANDAKSAFFFNMSHDIRTPMNAIIGFTNMGIKYIDDKEKVVECLQKTQQSGGMLLSLINSVLDMSKIEANKGTLDEKPGDVTLSFANIETTMKELGKAKDIEVTFEFGNITDRYVYADFNKCIRVFTNLISNAVKYTNNGGKVHVFCKQISKNNQGQAIFEYRIEDNGIGMSEEFQMHMFESFSREKNDTTNKIEGNGLGLAVCKTYVEFLKGHIECESQLGKGTTFILTLPFKIQEGQDYTDPQTGEVVSANAQVKQIEEYDLHGKHVLLVDDNKLNIEIASDMLEEEGLLVDPAFDGRMAIECIQEKGPNYYDFVLMDIQMPVLNGYETTREIRKMYPDGEIIIIALSANAFSEDREESLKAGMNDHIAKPIDRQVLLKVVSKHLFK